MARKKKRLMYPMICDKCGKSNIKDEENSTSVWEVFQLNCECGGKFQIDFDNPYYEERINNIND